MAKSKTPPPPDDFVERIVDIDVAAEMQGSFLEYAYSVIYSRALPDARDGPQSRWHPQRDALTKASMSAPGTTVRASRAPATAGSVFVCQPTIESAIARR